MGLSLVTPLCRFLDPLVEDLVLLLREDLSPDSLGEDQFLPLVATSVLEAVLVAVPALVVAGAELNLTPVAG